MNFIGGGGGGGRGCAAGGTRESRASASRGPIGAATAATARRRWWPAVGAAVARAVRSGPGAQPRPVGHGSAGAAARQTAVRTHHRRYNMNTGDIVWQVANGDTYEWIKTHPALKGVNDSQNGARGRRAASSLRKRWHLPDRAADCSEAAAAAVRCSPRTTR